LVCPTQPSLPERNIDSCYQWPIAFSFCESTERYCLLCTRLVWNERFVLMVLRNTSVHVIPLWTYPYSRELLVLLYSLLFPLLWLECGKLDYDFSISYVSSLVLCSWDPLPKMDIPEFGNPSYVLSENWNSQPLITIFLSLTAVH